MADNKTIDLLRKRLKEVEQDKDRREKELAKMGEKLRPDPFNADLRQRVQTAKVEIGRVCAEYGELARAVALASGGKNHFPAP